MSRVVSCVALALLFGSIFTLSSTAGEPTAKNSKLGKLRHVVIFKFKEGTTPQQIKAIEEGFGHFRRRFPRLSISNGVRMWASKACLRASPHASW